ncbi:ABC transporter ATP-binding protein [Bordetella sp. LUAb4]|uniref:ABC transporter ATP-binding protein n=1 Tax=Bordetella sp. LUAb4 TaxID=2843195 RepID=UPI001E57DFDE|nr:ABC transporter ATP-binding protein [Bordetella sp. LUAb4]
MSVLLDVQGVSKRYGTHQALDAVDLQVSQGEFVALLGPSGCGKTSLLRAIAGFLPTDGGRIAIDGEDVGRLPAHRRPLNTVFQNYALFPHMTVEENVAYGPRRQGSGRAEARRRALDALSMVGLESMGARYPRDMSGGQQQRVALARAIVNAPKLLLLDEPLSALDLKLRRRMQFELKHLQERLGIAFVFVTHDQEEAMTMADRIVVMNGGRIEQVGTGPQIYRAPASRFVAEFIGEANMLSYARQGEVLRMTGLAGLDVPVAALPLSDAAPMRGTAVLRPEDLIPLPGDGMARAPRIDARVTDVIRAGSHTVVLAQAAGVLLQARMPGDTCGLEVGATVALAFDPARLHLIGNAS